MDSNELLNQRAAYIADAKQILDKAEAENKRELTDEENTKYNGLVSEIDRLAKEADKVQKREQVEAYEAEAKRYNRKTAPTVITSSKTLDTNAANEVARSWALAGVPGHRPSAEMNLRAADAGFDLSNSVIQYRALNKSGVAPTIPTHFSTALEKALQYYFPIQSVIGTFATDDGNDYKWPTVDDTGNQMAKVAEEGTIGQSADPSFGSVTFKAYDYYSPIVKVSNQTLRDSNQDIFGLLAGLFSERQGLTYDAIALSTANGSSGPEGMLYGVSVGANLASGNAITVAKLMELETSVPLAYRRLPGVGFIMHDQTWQAIRQMADTTGRLLLNGDISNGVEKKLLGYPVHLSNNITSIQTPGDNQPLVLFGALDKYKFRRVGGATLSKMTELYAVTGQVGFCLHEAYDMRWITKAGVRTLNSYDAP